MALHTKHQNKCHLQMMLEPFFRTNITSRSMRDIVLYINYRHNSQSLTIRMCEMLLAFFSEMLMYVCATQYVFKINTTGFKNGPSVNLPYKNTVRYKTDLFNPCVH